MTPDGPGLSREELEEQKAFLFASLADLDAEWEAGDIEAPDYAALKDDYTARAAAVLRALYRLDGKTAPAPPAPARRAAPAAAAARRKRRWPLVASGVVALAVAVGAGLAVTDSSGERLPGQEPSGGPTQGASDLLDQATAADRDGKVLDALKLYDAVLDADPGNVIALTYKGWLLGRQPSAELNARAQDPLDRAVALDPTFPDAHAFRGLVLIRNKRPGEAVCELRTYLAIVPPDDPQNGSIEVALDEATKQAAGNVPPCPKPIQPAAGVPGGPDTTTGGTTP
jgi:tetratricopeptide (TPR) repeat protein